MSAPHAHDHAHPHDHAHSHAHVATDRRRLLAAIALTSLIFVAELVGGVISGSLALTSDAGHMLTDLSAQVISLLALLIAARPADARRSYGYRRAEILAALANGALLVVLSGWTITTAVHRFADPPSVRTALVLPIAVVGLLANAVAARLLAHSHSLNVRGAYLHILSDLLSSVAVIVGAAIMYFRHGAYFIDPLLGCLIALLVLVSAARLSREAVDVLLEGVPRAIDLDTVRADLAAVDGIAEVHDLHVWAIGTGLVAMSAHVVAAPGVFPGGYDPLLRRIDALLRARHGIHHSTVQIECEPGDCSPAH